jgi:hypothetical protein
MGDLAIEGVPAEAANKIATVRDGGMLFGVASGLPASTERDARHGGRYGRAGARAAYTKSLKV